MKNLCVLLTFGIVSAMTALLSAQQANTAAATSAVKSDSDAVIESKLKSIVIPNVDFNNVPLDRCLAVLGMISEEFDKTNDVSRGVKLVLKPSTGQSPEVTAKLENASLEQILKALLSPVQYRYEVTGGAVVISPAKQA